MKVIVVNNRYFISGGPERYLFRITAELENRGHTVIPFSIKSSKNEPTPYSRFFADPPGGQDTPYFQGMNFSLRTAAGVISRLFYSFSVRKKLSLLIQQEKPDAVYILNHYNKLSPSIIDACKENSIRTVIRLSDYFLVCPQAHLLSNGKICTKCVTSNNYFHAMWNRCIFNSFFGSALKSTALTFHHKLLKIYHKVDAIVCTNEYMAETLKVANTLQNKDIFCLPTPMPPWQSHSTHSDPANYIIYLGRVAKEKGVDLLLKAYCLSKVFEQGIKLHIVGAKKSDMGSHFWDLFSPDQKEIIDQNVLFQGFLGPSEIDRELNSSLFAVHPSRWVENLPNSILEAFSHHKPVITADIGSLPYVVKNMVNGLLYKYNDIASLANCISTLAHDDQLRDQLSKGIESTCANYQLEHHTDRLQNILFPR